MFVIMEVYTQHKNRMERACKRIRIRQRIYLSMEYKYENGDKALCYNFAIKFPRLPFFFFRCAFFDERRALWMSLIILKVKDIHTNKYLFLSCYGITSSEKWYFYSCTHTSSFFSPLPFVCLFLFVHKEETNDESEHTLPWIWSINNNDRYAVSYVCTFKYVSREF